MTIKLLTSEDMSSADKSAIEDYGVASLTLMENAGWGLESFVCELLGGGLNDNISDKKIVILCGKGNNGGDGYVAARLFKDDGFKDVNVFSTVNLGDLKVDALINANRWIESGESVEVISTVEDFKNNIKDASVIIDGLLGTGLKSEVTGLIKYILDCVNNIETLKVAIDIPSGVNGSTGEVMGTAFKADHTVTFAFNKIGLHSYPGKTFAGNVKLVDIGMPKNLKEETQTGCNLIDEDFVLENLPSRKDDTHKGTYGHVLIIGGSVGKVGAPLMSALGALRMGAGLVTVAMPECAFIEGQKKILQGEAMEVMTMRLAEGRDKTLCVKSFDNLKDIIKNMDCVVFGPGAGNFPDVYHCMLRVIKQCKVDNVPLVIDADGLNVLAERMFLLPKEGGDIILTPHPGEAARLLKSDTAKVQANRISSLEELIEVSMSTVVLKGAGTIIGGNDLKFINPTGNSGMATAGMGDVLAGMIGALRCVISNSLKASAVAVYLHGLAGDTLKEEIAEEGIIAGDILKALPKVLKTLRVNN